MGSLQDLIQRIIPAIDPLVTQAIGRETRLQLGLRRSTRLPVATALHAAINVPIILLTDRADHALGLADEIELWAPHAIRLLFPEPVPLFYENAIWGERTRQERLLVLSILAAYHIPGAERLPTPPIIIAPLRAVMTRSMPRPDFLRVARSLKKSQKIRIDEILRHWLRLGYEHVNTVISPGQFARRGGILDLWPPAQAQPVRLELFGDEIETLRHFDPITQRTSKDAVNATERILVTAAREFLTPETEQETYSEFHIPLLHPIPASLLEYIPREALILIDDRLALEEMANEVEEQAVKNRQDAIKENNLPDEFPLPYLTWSEIVDSLAHHNTLELGPSSMESDEPGEGWTTPDSSVNLNELFLPGARFGGRLKAVMEHLMECWQAGEEIILVSRQATRLHELWEDLTPLRREKEKTDDIRSVEPTFLEGSLAEGFIYLAPERHAIHLLSDGEVFGWKRPKPRFKRSLHYRTSGEAPEASYTDLQVGDYVVHIDHGIGQYNGLVHRTMDGIEREYLVVQYANEAQLFVPVHQVDRLSRYVGPDNRSPALSHLGSSEWRTVKAHVKSAVRQVAEELLELYARRSVVSGFAFNPDTTWQQELEASFPYIETEDQVRVIIEVKRDMESQRPMDRLICGDVGYGKTEVALRAAFKAVNDNRQVAVLVPTTVLAQQHYYTFRERLAAFPVTVEMLSRFRNPQQQKDIIERLAGGGIDILIGTHRMLSQDVCFKDLGLLIIDEEQRFGVSHKETLKRLRTEVDVLTLTATPIPRTLYMALSGIRDISTINTPPEERLPVITHVGPYSPRLVRQAILRELERGGQVFFVHNRIQTIGAMQAHLRLLVPQARISIAHGQMAEHELAIRMEQFNNGEIDILLSTSIIESGLDIPNANTLIVDRADTFGLAQLYQLRGRVGRGAQRAYAYFFRHNRKAPTPEGRARLETIAENTQLGAGFSIAMRDLEIRGTGDILGMRQSGHIAAVGFHLYTRLLSESVRKIRRAGGVTEIPDEQLLRLPQGQMLSVNIELPLAISIPPDYVPDRNVRLGLYRRLADIRTLSEVDSLEEEFNDRFGSLPKAVQNLFFQVKIKILAERAGLASITKESGQIVLRFPEDVLPSNLPDLGPGVRVGKVALWMPYENLVDWQARLEEVTHKLALEQVNLAI